MTPRGDRKRDQRPSVGIVGAGMAGLTAALRLAERGFAVTLYERNPYAGGLLSAHTHGDGDYHEHCYHMFLNWYNNFWKIVADVGLSRERDFEPREMVRYLRKRAPGDDASVRGLALYSPGSPAHVLDNMLSGVAPPPDMFLSAYSLIDLLTQRFRPGRLLDQFSVNSFMQSRPYASEHSALLHDYALAKAFAVPSYLTSASSYQSFIKFGLPHPDPLMWTLRANVEVGLIDHIRRKLVDLGCVIRLGCQVTSVAPRFDLYQERDRVTYHAYVDLTTKLAQTDDECHTGAGALAGEKLVKAGAIELPRGSDLSQLPGSVRHDYVILAVPPAALQQLMAPDSIGATRAFAPFGVRGVGIGVTPEAVNPSPRALSALRLPRVIKLKSEPMAALDVPFKRQLPGIPREHMVLMESDYGLALVDNSQAWGLGGNTLLNVIVTDFKALANLQPLDAVMTTLSDLSRYIDFDLNDVDWDRLHLQTNVGDKLFINEVGSEAYRPGPTDTEVPQLFLAGDFCRTPIDVVTVEAAVVSGLQAVKALQRQALADGWFGAHAPEVRPVAIVEPDTFPDAQLVALKLLLAPHAYAAKAWSWMNEQLAGAPRAVGPAGLLDAWSRMLFAPYAAATTWWRTGWDLWMDAARLPRDRR